MGFLQFLGGAVKILIAGIIALFAVFAATSFIASGKFLAGVIVLAVAFIVGMYVLYERAQQPKRL